MAELFWNYQSDNTKCPNYASTPTLVAAALINTSNEIVFSNYVVFELTDGPQVTIVNPDTLNERVKDLKRDFCSNIVTDPVISWNPIPSA